MIRNIVQDRRRYSLDIRDLLPGSWDPCGLECALRLLLSLLETTLYARSHHTVENRQLF